MLEGGCEKVTQVENCVHLPLGARLEKDGVSYQGELLGVARSLRRPRSASFSTCFLNVSHGFI